MTDDEIPPSLQESILTALMFDNSASTTGIAAIVEPQHFDEPFQEIATRVLSYRRKYKKCPGRAQVDDIFGWVLESGKRAPRLRRLIGGMVELSEGINPAFVLSKTEEFIRDQSLKSALQAAGERYQQGGEGRASDIERILYKALREKRREIDSGTFLDDSKRSLRFLDKQTVDFPIGIKQLDEINIGASIGEMLLYIAPKGSGKSWFAVHMGRQALSHRGKVLHITLEMPEEQVTMRYFQSMYDISRRGDEKYSIAKFELDELGRLAARKERILSPKAGFDKEAGLKYLRARMKKSGIRNHRLNVKGFPSGKLTMNGLEGYLDYLADAEKFHPTMLIVDYPDLMSVNPENLRLELGQIYVELRGLAAERKMAVIAPTQGNRSSLDAKQVRSSMVSEAKGKIDTSDNVLTYSQTKSEKRKGTARIDVAHSRHSQSGGTVVISQAYAVGQYVLESAWSSDAYWKSIDGSTEQSEDS